VFPAETYGARASGGRHCVEPIAIIRIHLSAERSSNKSRHRFGDGGLPVCEIVK
jgi:hypothetical protein